MRVLLAGSSPQLEAALAARGHELVTDGFDVAVDLDGPRSLAAAERAGARYLMASTTLIYGDGGEQEIEAAEPIIDPPPAVAATVDAELAVFSSGVRFLVLRCGIPFGPPQAQAFLDAVTARRMPAAPAWLPLLHPDDFAHFAVRALERDLNGLYDAVSDTVQLGDLARGAARITRAPDPPPDAKPPDPHVWLTSRRVTSRALAKVGLAPRWTWPQMLEAGLHG